VLLVQPRAFGFNSETAGSNTLQHAPSAGAQAVQAAALSEFNGLRQALQGEGVQVIVAEDGLTPVKPDAVFPTTGSASMPMARWCCIRCWRRAVVPSGGVSSSIR
jgi:hypothetical protein